MSFHYIIAQTQSQSSTLAGWLCRKKGLNDFVFYFLRNSYSVVAHSYLDAIFKIFNCMDEHLFGIVNDFFFVVPKFFFIGSDIVIIVRQVGGPGLQVACEVATPVVVHRVQYFLSHFLSNSHGSKFNRKFNEKCSACIRLSVET